jgi:P-type E1-E2 ATPase
MSIDYAVPGREPFTIEHVIFDVNGTLTDRGQLMDGVAAILGRLKDQTKPVLVSADTFGTLAEIGRELGLATRAVEDGEEKRRLVEELGAAKTAMVGNGTNDAAALAAAMLGVVVLGPEGTSAAALRAADVVCRSTVEAIELLLDPRALAATLRG